ncbi:uncharacterized protein EV422DRAFT_266450 [Fimicolochytrium jonesii]|uniref:uncharacterized protein n=1 Tax=Fimicolochytrium jonesii TaxID=1396493 RepID=UPI0022FDEE64|nr:uncharacterized protein EV422DRAFT_266450 [Fimicolochytrium jonesii]KAI8816941.1 hypothetical protein EV422DRAFT_266450 [Fimicolochytrium jonesii]
MWVRSEVSDLVCKVVIPETMMQATYPRLNPNVFPLNVKMLSNTVVPFPPATWVLFANCSSKTNSSNFCDAGHGLVVAADADVAVVAAGATDVKKTVWISAANAVGVGVAAVMALSAPDPAPPNVTTATAVSVCAACTTTVAVSSTVESAWRRFRRRSRWNLSGRRRAVDVGRWIVRSVRRRTRLASWLCMMGMCYSRVLASRTKSYVGIGAECGPREDDLDIDGRQRASNVASRR